MNFTKAAIGRQVSPISNELLCERGMYGRVLDVIFNRVVVRWADGRMSEHYQSELELVDQPQSIQK